MSADEGAITFRIEFVRDQFEGGTYMRAVSTSLVSSSLPRTTLEEMAADKDLEIPVQHFQSAIAAYLESLTEAPPVAETAELDAFLDQDFTLPPHVLAQINRVKEFAETIHQTGLDKQ